MFCDLKLFFHKFIELGYSREDVLDMISFYPNIIGYSEERIDTYITYKQLDNTSRKNSMKSSDKNEQNDQNDLSSNLIKFDRLEEINIKEQINKVYK